MPATARRHFRGDIARAKAMLDHARDLETAIADKRLVQDVRISAMALAVGALDAYLCDAYVDCLSSALQAYASGRWQGALPSHYAKQPLPAGVVLGTAKRARPLWSIRMAARAVMARDNMLSISRVPSAFNGILPKEQKLWVAVLPTYVGHGRRRLTGNASLTQLQSKNVQTREKAEKVARGTIEKRIGGIIQVRHDWIHNCGRPKVGIATFTHGEARARIGDVKRFMVGLDIHIDTHRLA